MGVFTTSTFNCPISWYRRATRAAALLPVAEDAGGEGFTIDR